MKHLKAVTVAQTNGCDVSSIICGFLQELLNRILALFGKTATT